MPVRRLETARTRAIATQTPLAMADKAAITTSIKIIAFIFYAPCLAVPSQCPKAYANRAAPIAGMMMAGTSITEGNMKNKITAIIETNVPTPIDRIPASGRGCFTHKPIIKVGRIADAQIV